MSLSARRCTQVDLRPACLCSKDSCARSVPVHLAPQPLPQTPPETRVAWWWHVYTPLLFFAIPAYALYTLAASHSLGGLVLQHGRLTRDDAWASLLPVQVNRMQRRRRGRGRTLSIAARSSGSHEDRLLGSAGAAPGAWRDAHAMPFAVSADVGSSAWRRASARTTPLFLHRHALCTLASSRRAAH